MKEESRLTSLIDEEGISSGFGCVVEEEGSHAGRLKLVGNVRVNSCRVETVRVVDSIVGILLRIAEDEVKFGKVLGLTRYRVNVNATESCTVVPDPQRR